MNTVTESNSTMLELTSCELDAIGGGLCSREPYSVTYSETCSLWPPFDCISTVTFTYACN